MSQSTEGALPPTSGPVPTGWTTSPGGAPAVPAAAPGTPFGAGAALGGGGSRSGSAPAAGAAGAAGVGSGSGAGRGLIPLRPMLAGEILDGAVTVMRGFPRTVFGVSAVVVVLSQAVSIPLDYLYLRFLANVAGDTSSGFDVQMLTLLKPGALLSVLAQTVLLGGLLVPVVSRGLLGRSAAPGEVWHLSRPRVPRLVALTLLACLVLGAVLAAGVVPGVLLVLHNASGGPGVLALGLCGAGVVVLWRGVAWSLAGAALMLEDQPVRVALKRSSAIVKGSWWRLLGVRLAAMLVAALAALGLNAGQQQLLGSALSPETVNSDGTVSGHTVTWATILLAAVFSTAMQAIITPFAATVTALQYMDQRMRREGLDIQLARRGTPAGPPAGTSPAGGAAA